MRLPKWIKRKPKPEINTGSIRIIGTFPNTPEWAGVEERFGKLAERFESMQATTISDFTNVTDHIEAYRQMCEGAQLSKKIAKDLDTLIARYKQNRRLIENIITLSSDEGDRILIPNPNPDFEGVGQTIKVKGPWTNGETIDFDGDTLADALETAAIARRLHDNPPPATDDPKGAK